MLESTVARILNQLLGKYVQDLDTENLNVGIFSGTVQLCDLKLKPEALYELRLPVEVKVGTIGKICIEIPWTALWNQPVIVNIEDLHAVVNPIVSAQTFDCDRNKRLVRAFKKRTLELLEQEAGGILGGPAAFAEHLISNILNHIQINIVNVHIRYEDDVSWSSPMAAGLCVGVITAETTNSKWKRTMYDPNSQTGYYLVKVEAFSVYWNVDVPVHDWDFPSQYYQWKNAMVDSLQTYSFEKKERFNFILNPITSKIRMCITKRPKTGQVAELNTDVIVRDCSLQLSKTQYDSMTAVLNNMERMLVSWHFLAERPRRRVIEDRKAWWKYAYWATLEQRVRPLTWSRIKKVRHQYKEYMETYKQIISNPNDTELKLDLQKHEDNLSVVNIVVARQHTRLLMQSKSQNEKSFWSMLPSPEKIVLCEKIGYYDKQQRTRVIDHTFTFKLGNFNVCFSSQSKEILIVTLTQTICTVKPNFLENTFKASLKIEGLIVEGNGANSALTSLVSSEHLKDSPAFFFNCDWDKVRKDEEWVYKLRVTLNPVECIYNKRCFQDIETFLQATTSERKVNLLQTFQKVPAVLYESVKDMLSHKWELDLNVKSPYLVIPESSSCVVNEENVLVIDLGKYWIRTEICQETHVSENATKMEMEEQVYSKLLIDCTNLQVLFCDRNDHWKEARNEKDTAMHLVSKTSYSAVYALPALEIPSIPKLKFNILLNTIKLNISERKIFSVLKFFNSDRIRIDVITEAMQPDVNIKDSVKEYANIAVMKRIQDAVCLPDTYKSRKHKALHGPEEKDLESKNLDIQDHNMNEAWAHTVDLPGLEDNISMNNTIEVLYGFIFNELIVTFSKSSDCSDREYLALRVGLFSMDVAFMTFGPAYQMSIHSLILTDKLHTTRSGQYLGLISTPLPNNMDVVTVLYRKVSAKCPDFWTHFHGVETSLVANFGSLHVLLHQEAIHTLVKYLKYLTNKISLQTCPHLKSSLTELFCDVHGTLHKPSEYPVPPGSVKFSQSARMTKLVVMVCDSDYDIITIHLSGLEVDFLFRANERFVFRSYLSNINVDHLLQFTFFPKVLDTEDDKVFEVKYVRNAAHLNKSQMLDKKQEETSDGSFKFHLGRIHFIFIYKLMVQLQRFVINLEVLEYCEKYVNLVEKAVNAATDTLKDTTKISLSINVDGPVLLVPQKTFSPHVLVINTGNLRIENFFKEYDNGVVENILVKLKDVTVARAVMMLPARLHMQELLIEPICISMDVKKFTNIKTLQNNWEIDSVLEKIEVTLGQKDLSVIMGIYTDNIGESKIVDLLPEQMRSPISEIFDQDENVRELEAFFCEPKQKFLAAKCKIEEIQVVLFFDTGERFSSPIRDFNHGLCKLEVKDIDTSLVIYSDKSSDGKLSVDYVLIEEIGPDANIHSKIVLSSPAEDGRNNNICNITVNKPPIVDVNFHQTKNGDQSADVIVGRLCLSLSIPFCEKVALYVLECMPKETQDLGIVNAAYEGDLNRNCEEDKKFSNSLTISLRVNKPELMFLVETTSNKKRYFLTKSEIMIDFSRHCNRLNLVTSLSGLHSLFYDLSEYSDQPYVVLKQCDIELSKNVEENCEKFVLNVSGVYVKLCSEVVHSVSDILNDIIEHFKIPEAELRTTMNLSSRPLDDRSKWNICFHDKGSEDDAIVLQRKLSNRPSEDHELWDPKKMEPYIDKPYSQTQQQSPVHLLNQHFTVPKFELVLIFELEQIQVLLVKASLEAHLQDWNYLLNSSGEISLQSNYFNESLQSWEPIVDPVTVEEGEFRPWECHFMLFQDKARYISDPNEKPAPKRGGKVQKKPTRSYTTTESEDSGEDMVYLHPVNAANLNVNRRVKTSLSTFLEDSDSENEEGAMEKLAAAISDLFTGDWNEHEDSECEHSSEDDISETSKPIKSDQSFGKCLFLLVNAKDTFNITVTPTFLKVFNELIAQYSSKIVSVKQDRKAVTLVNDIAPQSRVELYEKTGEEKVKLISTKKFENEESPPTSPGKRFLYQESVAFEEEHLQLKLLNNEHSYDFTTIQSLNFPKESTGSLYDKFNGHYLKIFVPNFLPLQTNCSTRNFEKIVKLQPDPSSLGGTCTSYYLGVRQSIGRNGREVTIGSPLQIRNETRFALNILYQPSVLQQMNVEPVGDVTNPFETTMRIRILEAHETYNVPLYIAYHCKIFIQPAYAEGHCASETGIWWWDMARELDTAYNLICHPKSVESSVEIFALRVLLTKNLRVHNSLTHSVPNYSIRLLPPLTVQNFLPYTLEVEILNTKQTVKADPVEKCSVYTLDLTKDQKLTLKMTYNALTWTGQLTLSGHLDDKVIPMTSDQKSEKLHLCINVKCEREESCNLLFYSPYWISNKTGLPLKVKASNAQHVQECPSDDILLFSYKRHSKQTLNIQLYESMWSSDFSAECSGTTGLIVCKDNERKKRYMFFMNSSLSHFCPRLTKIVSILPSFLVTNNSTKRLRFMEDNEKTDLWIDLEPGQTVVHWPDTGSMQIFVKYRDSNLISQPVFVARQHKTVLRMEKATAITVETTGGTSDSFRTTFDDYKSGDCPVLVKNYCVDLYLKIQQKDQSHVTLLNPSHSVLYTWDNPVLSRVLTWNVYNNKGTGFVLDIYKDGYGQEKIKFHSVTSNTSQQESSSSEDSDSSGSTPNKLNKRVRKDKIVIYWACFVEDSQRTLLFAQEHRIYENALQNRFKEYCSFETVVSVTGVGLSLFTAENVKTESLYATICDYPATWEVNVGQKWKTLTLELASWIEDKYKRSSHKKCQIKDYVHIDFEKMFMLKPFFAEMRRTYVPGVSCHYRKSPKFSYVDLQFTCLQIDNKESNCIIVQPNFNNNNNNNNKGNDLGVKHEPVLKAVIFKQNEHDFQVYRHIGLEIGDLILNVENDIWIRLGDLIKNHVKFTKDYSYSAGYVTDITNIRKKITDLKVTKDASLCRIEHVTVSSFAIQLTISNRRQMGLLSDSMPLTRLLDYLFPYNMAPYMPLEGVHHKITATEWVDVEEPFTKAIVEHVSCRFLQQYYSQVLGLQVLVNSFDRHSGVEASTHFNTQNADALTISYGSRCLLGHVAMSPAALETCILDVFPNLNLDIIAKRKPVHSHHGDDNVFSKVIAVRGKHFEVGVPIALAQLFVKNYSTTIQCDGEMFFKTSGKALFSLITRHPDDKADCVDLAKEALRRALILGEPIRIHQRLTRYTSVLGLHPFSTYESMGHYLLSTLANQRFSSDRYWTHVTIDKTGKSMVLVSLEHVIKINKRTLWGSWEIEWQVDLDDIISLPKVNQAELILNVKLSDTGQEEQIKIMGLNTVVLWLHEKIEQAIVLSMEDKAWTVQEAC